MQHPEAELLAAVALGEDVDSPLTAHLAACATCRGDVADLARVAQAVRVGAPLVPPPPGVWSGVRVGIAPASRAAEPPTAPRGVPRRSFIGWLAAAAAAGAATGAAATWLLTRPDPAPGPVVSADLTTLDTREVLGEASVRETDRGVVLAVHTQQLDPRDGFLEVWLINRDLARMVSVGILPAGVAEQYFPIARRLLDEGYVVVDISREAFDDRPEHSGDSLVRGELPL